MSKTAGYALILAAGTSSRMGEAKQLIQLEGQYILERVINQVMRHPFKRVIIILGYCAEEIKGAISIHSDRVEWIYNPNFLKGQSTSLLAGLSAVPESISAATVFLGDQPFIDEATISSIISIGKNQLKQVNDSFVIRPFYKGTPGHPVYWGNIHCLPMSDLSGDRGGVQLMKYAKQHSYQVDDPFVFVDVDTPSDLADAKRMSHFLT
ncbi:nucleotidyltransferase family protein [Salipaludibacillus sp. HK11]|uniref:nucleotidyltransferase family protein n=1 Tax=Salipaludibacillus sp. HK11 TaxID=3394320 RepID=UPI0039FC5766